MADIGRWAAAGSPGALSIGDTTNAQADGLAAAPAAQDVITLVQASRYNAILRKVPQNG